MKLLAENQTLTNTFTDIGLIIGPKTIGALLTTQDDVISFSFLTVGVVVTMNTSTGFEIQALALDENTLQRYDFPIETVKKNIVNVEPLIQTFKKTGNISQLFQWELDTTIDAVQLQVRVNTVGATAGIATSTRYNLGYRQ